jgi:hypothetical protein
LWAKTEPQRALAPNRQIQCHYTEQPQRVPNGANRPTVLVCSPPISEEQESDSEQNLEHGDLTSFPGVIRHLLHKTVSDPVSFFTLVLALFTWRLIIVGRAQHAAATSQFELSRSEYLVTQRPRLIIRNINVKQFGEHDAKAHGPLRNISPGDQISGQLYIENFGGSKAKLEELLIMFWFSGEPLPMGRPYEGRNGNEGVPSHWIERNRCAAPTFLG